MENWGPAFRLIGVGFYICACIGGGVVGGLWLDNRFNSQPIFLLICLILGLVVAFWGSYRMIAPLLNSDKKGRK